MSVEYEFWLPTFILDWGQTIGCLLVVGITVLAVVWSIKYYLKSRQD